MSFVVDHTKEGTGPVCPAGAFVTCHYHGTLLDGTVFDSSVQKGRPFKFQVGVGQVIRAWDEGIIQLKKGGKATLTAPPDYAYGERGAGGVIPPNATLKFDVELLDFVPSVQASHILLKHSGSRNPKVSRTGQVVTRTKDEAIAGIQEIRQKVLNDPSSFASIA